jgi:hypothetical protein
MGVYGRSSGTTGKVRHRTEPSYNGDFRLSIKCTQLFCHKIGTMATHLSCEAPDAVGDRQADYDHVHEQSNNQIMKRVRTLGVKGGKR